MQRARIYRPARSAMTSGMGNTKRWVLEFQSDSPLYSDPLMGWTGSDDTKRQIRLRFDTLEDAQAYAKKYNIHVDILPVQPRRRILQTYADNFK